MADDKDKTPDERPARPERAVSRVERTTLGGRELEYTVTAATLNLKDDAGKDRASVFHVAYTLNGVTDPSRRPVMFCFNGGPGSSSVWLQFGAFGPRRIDLPDTLAAPPPPYALVDNAEGLLDATDLVFIDPVGTGFSRAVGEAKDEDFHSVADDVASVGELVWRWLARHDRFNSPKLLAGESYGTTRAAGLAHHLQERGIAISGIALVSLAVDFHTFHFRLGQDLPHVLYLPSYAATAYYHDRLDPKPADLDAFLAEARAFALDRYMPALLRGTSLPEADRDALAAELSRFTGLPADEIARRELRIPYLWFVRQLLGPGTHTVGRLDSRYVGHDEDPHGDAMVRDPSYDAAVGAYTAVVNDHLRRELGWQTDDAYLVLSREVNQTWRWTDPKQLDRMSTAEALRRAMVANPHLRVLFANGLFDLATPFFAAEHTAHHLGTSRAHVDHIELEYYGAGHMMYFHPPSRAKLRDDMVRFIARAVSG